MSGSRITVCLALWVAGCGTYDLPAIGVSASAVNSCNVVTDCPMVLVNPGSCVQQVCTVAHECDAITSSDMTACPGGCMSDGDCSLGTGTGVCYQPSCNTTTHQCDFAVPMSNTTCACKVASDCAAPSNPTCQNAPTCNLGVCTYSAKTTTAGCCNSDTDCNTSGVAASCNASVTNRCVCGNTKTYCPLGPSGCVSGTECCQDSECGAGNTCNDGTCACGGSEVHCPGVGCLPATDCCGNADCSGTATCNGTHACTCGGGQRYCAGIGCIAPTGCCSTAECSGTATCDGATHACVCGAGEKYCAGTGCIPSTGCCSVGDCAARANATVACTTNACVYDCDSGFHNCSGVCKADSSVASCGNSCSACPAGNSCQTAVCNSGACDFTAAGASPCCNAPTDCTPENGCQAASACTANRCVFGSTGASGCCDSAADCPAPTDACLTAACVANQCATAPIAGCTDGGGQPGADDMNAASSDLAGAVSLSGGGGCALAGGRTSPPAPGLFAFAFVTLALIASARRRRRSA